MNEAAPSKMRPTNQRRAHFQAASRTLVSHSCLTLLLRTPVSHSCLSLTPHHSITQQQNNSSLQQRPKVSLPIEAIPNCDFSSDSESITLNSFFTMTDAMGKFYPVVF